MSTRLPAPPAPGPLEAYAAAFDPCFVVLAQRCGFRQYLQGVLLPRDRNKTLTALAGAEPITQAQAAPVQRLQAFLSESTWDVALVQQQRLTILLTDPATRPHEGGVLILDETGDRKDGSKTAYVARQYLGSLGKVENGIVAVTSLWADERVSYPLHGEPYDPAERLPKGKEDPAFRTKPQIGMALVDAALALGLPFRAVVADCVYGESAAFEGALGEAGVPYVVGLRPAKGHWAPEEEPHTPQEAAQALGWNGPDDPQDWTPVVRRFRDGHTETWWSADLTLAGYSPEKGTRLVVATTDPATLPEATTWYLATILPRPGSPQTETWPGEPADLAEIVRLYGLRNWVEQSYKQAKQELGWADFQVRRGRAIRRHGELVCCAFCFCWWHRFHRPTAPEAVREAPPAVLSAAGAAEAAETRSDGATAAGGERRAHPAGRPALPPRGSARGAGFVAPGPPGSAGLAGPLALPLALLASVERLAPTTVTPGLARCCG
jgi:DDE superfamily endonuclease